MDHSTQPLIVLPPEEGQTFRVLSDLMTFKLVSKQTQNAFFLCFSHVPPQSGVAMHKQAGQETFIIFEGEVEFSTLSEEKIVTFPAPRGTVVHIPEQAPHAYRNVSDAPASMFVLFAPGGAERFFQQLGVPVTDQTAVQASPRAPFDPELLQKLSLRYGVQLVVPPSDE